MLKNWDKSKPMPVKYWSFAGLMLTYWCNARCASCYTCSSPSAGEDMSVEMGLAIWEGLISASPHGCRIHISGGEPFGRWETLIELAREAKRAGLKPLEAVETNAYWATDEKVIRERIKALDEAGMFRLKISADPYHQQYIPIERVRLLAKVAEEILGTDRVRIRWEDWAREGFDTGLLSQEERQRLFAAYALKGRDRLTGRAAVELSQLLPLKPPESFADNPCWSALLRSRHVHVDGKGIVCPGVCTGIILGIINSSNSVSRIWQNLWDNFVDDNTEERGDDIISLLVRSGPVALLQQAERLGYARKPDGYASKCHLCWDVRRWLFENGYFSDRLGPASVYKP